MALWEYNIQNPSFNLQNYPPLTVANYTEEFTPVPFTVDIYYTYYSTLFYTTYTYRVVMSGNITKYKQNVVGSTSNYPSLTLYLGGSTYGEGRCGTFINIANCCEVSDFVGYVIDNGVQRELTTADWSHTFSGGYTANGNIRVDVCTLPIIFSDCSEDESGYMANYSTSGSVYNVPSILQFDNYIPVASANNPLTKQLCEDYIINFTGGEVSPEGQEFRLEVQWTTGTWTNDTQPSVVGQPSLQAVKGKITDGKFALYIIEGIDDGKLKYGIKNTATFYDLEYSTDGVNWTPTDIFPFEFIYRKRYNELGTFSYALSEWNTDIPIWDNEQDADDYLEGTKDISESRNWDRISSQYPPSNYTGIDDDVTEMGEVYTRSFFSQQYICSASALQEISNAFFDTDSGGITGIVDDIIKGLRMYGEDISNAIQGLMFFPIDLNQVFTSVQSQNYIYFGGYQFQMQNSVNKIIYPNGYIDFGSFVLKPSFNSYRDHAPYTRLYCYLAYIGWIELDVDRYLGKTVSIRYYIDTRTGGCLACIFANGVLTDYATGQMGVQMPITVTSYTEYANAQLQTLLTFGNGQGQNVGNIASMGGQLAQSGVSGGAIATASVGLGAVGLGIGATKTLYGLTQNNINNFNKTKGGSTGMLNMFLPQDCLFLFEIQDSDETPNERNLQGYPSNASGQLQSFSGYLEVDSVNLVCGGATDNEKAEIIAQLKSGVII